uniref:CRAL-TRIO domain-containing protein n=1 Tax=Romanomermis culicivorax TaxID=13658 RepID=A0A915IJ58_ROMCU
MQNKEETGILKLDLDSVLLNERLQEAMSDASASDLETAKSTARSQSMSVQLDWLDDDYIDKTKSDTENVAPSTSRTYGRGSISEEDNLTQKSARTENGGEKEQIDLEWESMYDCYNDTPVNKASQNAETDTSKRRSLKIFGSTHDIDMAMIEPYRKECNFSIFQGYFTDGFTAIVVFYACYLPHRTTPDYHNLMENLFFYAVSSLEKVVAEDYVIVYFQGGASNDQLPSFSWLRKCYRLMDQRLVSYTEPGLDRNIRKNLKQLVLVHSTFWLKTIVTLSKPFISSKFYKKIKFVNSLQELSSVVPLEQMEIPESVLRYNFCLRLLFLIIAPVFRHEDKKHEDSNSGDTDH